MNPLRKSDVWKAVGYQKIVEQLSFAKDYIEKIPLFLSTSTYLSLKPAFPHNRSILSLTSLIAIKIIVS